MIRFEGVVHFSVSTEEHQPTPYAFYTFPLFVRYPERSESYYDLGAALSLLPSVECLVTHKCVGQEVSMLLSNLGGPGARILFPTNILYQKTVCSSSLLSIDFQCISGSLFRHKSFEPVQALGLSPWATKTSGISINTVRITQIHAHLQDFARWREFLPNALVEEGMEFDEVSLHSYLMLEGTI